MGLQFPVGCLLPVSAGYPCGSRCLGVDYLCVLFPVVADQTGRLVYGRQFQFTCELLALELVLVVFASVSTFVVIAVQL